MKPDSALNAVVPHAVLAPRIPCAIQAVSRNLLSLLTACLGLVGIGAHAQNVFSAQIVGQPLVYMKAGNLNGCGIRLIIVDPPMAAKDNTPFPVWDLSFNMYLPDSGAIKIGSYNVSPAELRSGRATSKPNTIPTATGWLKAPNADATVPLGKVGKSDDPGFILYWADTLSVMGLFNSFLKNEPILVGTKRAGAKTERIFSGAIEMPEGDKAQVRQCLTEFLSAAPK